MDVYLSSLMIASLHSFMKAILPLAKVTYLLNSHSGIEILFLLQKDLDIMVIVLPVSMRARIGVSKNFISRYNKKLIGLASTT